MRVRHTRRHCRPKRRCLPAGRYRSRAVSARAESAALAGSGIVAAGEILARLLELTRVAFQIDRRD